MPDRVIREPAILHTETISKEEFESFRKWVQEEFQKKDQRIEALEQENQKKDQRFEALKQENNYLQQKVSSLQKVYIASVQYILSTHRCLSKDGHLLCSNGELLYKEE